MQPIINKPLNTIKSNEIDSSDVNLISQPNLGHNTDINKVNEIVGNIELLEERAVINKERLDVGKVTATKHIRTKTVNVPIELVEEVLTINTEYYNADSEQFLTKDYASLDIVQQVEPTLDSKPVITVNGNVISLEEGAIEIVLSRQYAVIQKETYAVQDVTISKSVHQHKDTINVELKREELEVIEEGMLDKEL